MLVASHPIFGKVCVLGTCRVINPVRDAVLKAGGSVLLDAPNTYSQNVFDAAQLLEIVAGRPIPKELESLILGHDCPVENIPRNAASLVEGSDYFIVETSTLYSPTDGKWHFSANYLSTIFTRGGGLPMLEWYRKLSSEKPNVEIVENALQALKSCERVITPDVVHVLSETLYFQQSEIDTAQKFQELIKSYGNRWILIPIFTLENATEQHLIDREIIKSTVRNVAEKTGCGYYDPTDLINSQGRELALDANGKDIYHYSKDFSPILGKDLLEKIAQTPIS